MTHILLAVLFASLACIAVGHGCKLRWLRDIGLVAMFVAFCLFVCWPTL